VRDLKNGEDKIKQGVALNGLTISNRESGQPKSGPAQGPHKLGAVPRKAAQGRPLCPHNGPHKAQETTLEVENSRLRGCLNTAGPNGESTQAEYVTHPTYLANAYAILAPFRPSAAGNS
jgi:hypothetical protein